MKKVRGSGVRKSALQALLMGAITVSLVACGGGGGGTADAVPNATELEGTWINATDGHTNGSACTNDPDGKDGVRSAYSFAGNKYVLRLEQCQPPDANGQRRYQYITGSNGVFAIGRTLVDATASAPAVRELDLVSGRADLYTAVSVSGGLLTFANKSEPGRDGRTVATRYVDSVLPKLQFQKQ